MMNSLNSLIIEVKDLSISQTQEMWEFYKEYYSFVDREMFFKDLAEKTHVIFLNDDKATLRGFSTQKNYHFLFQKELLNIVFSGDTFIEPKFWGSQELVLAFSRFMVKLKAKDLNMPLYWFLICSGFRTYRYLPVFCKEFYPRYDRPTPPYEKELMDALATAKFSREYRDGIIRVKGKKAYSLFQVFTNYKKRRNPHIDFFIKKNPDFGSGHELVCLAEFSIENTPRLVQSVAKEGLVLPN